MTEKIIEIINELRPYEEISYNTELIQSRILDSLAVFALVTQLEDCFGIEIPDDAVTADNFSSVTIIARLIKNCNL